jgi:UDP-2-acetamido-2,6-beta-L-arabino-hexul-4-ose reductase
MKVLVTGSNGFIAKNLAYKLKELKIQVLKFNRDNSLLDLKKYVDESDFVFHLAGANRPKDEIDFTHNNIILTEELCNALKYSNKTVPVVFSSSIQAEKDNPYGKSKKKAEDLMLELSKHNPVYIYRLPNVFGKWCRPNYNSVVATFCHNLINDIPITIHDPSVKLQLVYVDDVVENFTNLLSTSKQTSSDKSSFYQINPVYSITVGELADKLLSFKNSRSNLITESVGIGLDRALNSTFLSYYKPEQFSYDLPIYKDQRGDFVEFLKTRDSGQFSYFTAHPGVTRGGHYHHTKTEKFLVLQGQARFRFRNIESSEYHEITVDSSAPRVVETIPGWTHDITNTGNNLLIVMLWANEIFDRSKPDTYQREVNRE